jgi:2-dehydropantoate 2-reductase
LKFIVFGAGAVGGYFGGRLANAGVDTTFFVRERRAEVLRSRGLRVQSVYGDFSLEPHVITSPVEVENPDVVILALKNYHLDAAISSLTGFIDKGAVILPLMNGVKHVDRLISLFGEEHVLGGTCSIESTLDQNGDVVHTSKLHNLVYGAFRKVNLSLEDLDKELQKGGFRVRQSQDIRYDLWQKFLFLTSLSGVTAATGQPVGVILADSESRAFLLDMIGEGCRVARAEGIQLPDNQEELILNGLEKLAPAMTSSMHRDMMKLLPIELDSLQGAMLEMAQSHGMVAPCYKAAYQLLHPYKAGGRASLSIT